MNKPNVFTDFHHAGLLHSLILLFEGRFGGNVYRPIGMEWAEQGFWKVFDHPATQMQYLGIGGATPDGTPPLNEVDGKVGEIYLCQDIDSGYYNKAITLSTFYRLPIDLVIASIPQHIEPFKRLCENHPNKPKLIYQIGNSWTVDAGLAPNIMASAKIDNVPPEINFVSYHQEFDLNIFKPKLKGGAEGKKIYSFVNCFGVAEHFNHDFQLFEKVEKLMPDYEFRAFGGQCRDGSANGAKEVAQKMDEALFVWHTKYGGDGYGHIIFNTGAMAKPTIVKAEYYRGKLGEKLFIDGETAIFIDGLRPFQIVDKILRYSEPKIYEQLCENVMNNFKSVVDFENEYKKISIFLDNLR